jgi:hypothetical protein
MDYTGAGILTSFPFATGYFDAKIKKTFHEEKQLYQARKVAISTLFQRVAQD